MKINGCFALLVLAACAISQAQAPQRKKLLVIGGAKGYQHDSISYAMAAILRLDDDNNLWDAYLRTDSRLITKQSLAGPGGRRTTDTSNSIATPRTSTTSTPCSCTVRAKLS